MNEEDFQSPETDQAIADRLAKLRTLPVDTTRLEQAIRARIPETVPRRARFWPRPIQAIAASVVLLSALAAVLLLNASSGPAMAGAAEMAQVHEDIVSGKVPVMQVSSIVQANQMLASTSPGTPPLPDVPREHVMACCMKSLHNKKMACVLLKNDGVPVTLTVANAADMKLPPAPIVQRAGIAFRVQSVGDLNMVMTERNGRWLCLIGRLPSDRLMAVAAQVQF